MTKKLLVLIPILAVALAVMWASPRDSQATTWNPFFGPTDFYSLTPTTPGANSDIHAQFNTNAPSTNFSALFGRAITFGDTDVFNASAAQIPGVGAYMGQLSSVATLGLANEGCSSTVPVTFNFVEANVDTAPVSIDTPPGNGNPTTTNDPLLVVGSIPAAAAGSSTTFTYGGASGTDPLGKRVSDNLPINIIDVEGERMLITDVDYLANTYTVTRGWEGTPTAAHGAVEIRRVNIIFPAGPNDNLLANMAEDDGDMDNNLSTSTNATDGHGHAPAGGVENADYINQVSDGADSGSTSFVRDSYDPDGNQANGGYVQPHARYYGVAFVASSLIVTLQFVIGAPGQLATFPNLQWATSAWGYSSTTFLQDPLAPPSNSAISDFCNFTSNTTLFGVPHDNACTGAVTPPAACTGTGAGFTLRLAVDNGCPSGTVIPPTNPNECGLAGQANGICPATTCPRSTNPATAQNVKYYQYSVSQRDYDNDGHENALDVCFNIPNGPGGGTNWNPRVVNLSSGQDADGDGAPDPCDTVSGFSNDQDGDAWQNRIDNCPTAPNSDTAHANGGGTVPNTFQYDLDVAGGVNVPDGGPASDSIGVTCDQPGNNCTGCPALTPTGANGHYHATAAAQAICIGAANNDCNNTPGVTTNAAVDQDGDGVTNASDTCLNGANPPFFFGPGAVPGSTTVGAAGVGAGGTVIPVASTAGLIQGNAVQIAGPGASGTETLRYITAIGAGTITVNAGVTNAHASGGTVRMISFAQSLRDMDNDGFVTISDISLLTGAFGSEGGNPGNDGVGDSGVPGYQGRYDTDYDSFVTITDISSLTGMFGNVCGPP